MKNTSTSKIEALEILIAETEAAIERVNRTTGDLPRLNAGDAPSRAAVDASVPRGAPKAEIAIELPHGQILTVRGLEEGYVVEVASWTGMGPPDESALRMLFGANKNNSESPSTVPKTGSDHTELNSLLTEGESNTPDDEALARERQRATTSRKASMSKKLITVALILATVTAVIVGLRISNLVLFEHPDGGLTGGLGPASSTVVAVGPGAPLEPNASVLAEIDGVSQVAGVVEVGDRDVLVFTGDGQVVVPLEKITGRVLLVVPFIGYLLG